jgi:trk system potassium uptake protein TrkA
MYIVVVGMGQVGRHVVRTLEREQHDVVVIDIDPAALRYVEEHHDVATVLGYGASQQVLSAARVDEADLLVAVTDHDEVNLIAALASKQLGAKRVIARVQGPEWVGSSERAEGVSYGLLGVDVVFNPRVLLAQEIAKIAQSHGALEVVDIANNRIEVVQMELGQNRRVVHHTLAKLPLPDQVLVGAVVREGELFVPGGADVLLPEDRIYLLGLPDRMVEAEDLFSHSKEARSISIVGGGVIGEALTRELLKTGAEVRLVERNAGRAVELGGSLPGATVMVGDGTDLELLEEEGLAQCDLFVAVTHEDEANLMACLLAKRAGAGRTCSLVHRPDYVEIYRQLGIDVVLSPRTVASDHILRYCRHTRLQTLIVLEDGAAEVLEIVAPAAARIVGTPMRRLSMPRGALIAAILKGDRVVVPHGDDVVEAGDHVVVLCTQDARSAVGRLFKARAL